MWAGTQASGTYLKGAQAYAELLTTVIIENNRRGKKKSIYKVFHAFPMHLWCALDVPDEGIKYDPRR